MTPNSSHAQLMTEDSCRSCSACLLSLYLFFLEIKQRNMMTFNLIMYTFACRNPRHAALVMTMAYRPLSASDSFFSMSNNKLCLRNKGPAFETDTTHVG